MASDWMTTTPSVHTLVRNHLASQQFNPESVFGPDSSDAWAIIRDIASCRPDLFAETDGAFDCFDFGEFVSDLEAALTWGGSFPAGKLWIPPASSALTSRPEGWGDVSPVHPDQLSDAAAKYLKQPAWQTNRADWILLSAFLFDALARTYDTTMSNPGGYVADAVLWRRSVKASGEPASRSSDAT